MQFPQPIVRQLVIYDNSGNPVVIIGPGPHIIAAGTDGEIDIDASTARPSIIFWNTDRTDFGRIQLFDSATNRAGIEFVGGKYLSSQYPSVLADVRNKLVFQDIGSGTSALGPVRMDTLTYLGGLIVFNDVGITQNVKNATGVTMGQINVFNAGVPGGANVPRIYLQTGDGTALNGPVQTVEGDHISFKGPTLGDPGIEYRTTTRAWVRQGTDGVWTDLQLKNGWTFLAGYRRGQARIDALGNVQLRGTIRAGIIADNTWIFDVPFASMTPNANILLRPAIGPTGAGSAGSSRIFCNATNGFFCYGLNAGGTTDLGLDGLNYTLT